MRRPLLDLSAQLLPVMSQLIERIFLTGLLVQRLGVGQFERWSLISAIVTLLTMVDLGTQITFSNRMSRAAHRGDVDEAVTIFRQSNTIFALLGMIVMAATILFATVEPLQYTLGLNQPLGDGERIVALCLGASVALRLAMTNASGVYRSMLAFGRGTLVVTVGDLLRIAAGIGALLLVGSMASLATAMAGATLVMFGLLIPLDIARRFPAFGWRLTRPTALTTRGTLSESILFASGFLPTIVLTQIPIMLIGSRAAQGVLAGYVLLRTITNVVRTMSQKVTSIVGMELSRLETQGRQAELASSYRYLSALAALSFGAGGAMLWAWGDVILRVWTGSSALFDPLLLAVMLAPLVLTPGTQLNIPLLIYGHRPAQLAIGVTLQTGSAALLAVLLPIESIALRLTVALSLAELLFLAPALAMSTRRMIGSVVTRVAVPNLLFSLAAMTATLAITITIQRYAPGVVGMVLSALAVAVVLGPIMILMTRRLMNSLAKRPADPCADALPLPIEA